MGIVKTTHIGSRQAQQFKKGLKKIAGQLNCKWIKKHVYEFHGVRITIG